MTSLHFCGTTGNLCFEHRLTLPCQCAYLSFINSHNNPEFIYYLTFQCSEPLAKSWGFFYRFDGDMGMAVQSLVNFAWNPQPMFLGGQQISFFILLSLMHQTYLLVYTISLYSNENDQNLAKVSFQRIFSLRGILSLWEISSLQPLFSNVAWTQGKRQYSSLKLNFRGGAHVSNKKCVGFNCKFNGTQIKHLTYWARAI